MRKMWFRKRPVLVQAYQTDKEIYIDTLEGRMKADVGDWIITGVNGEEYPCKPDIFEKTYERALTPSEVEHIRAKRELERIEMNGSLEEKLDYKMACFLTDLFTKLRKITRVNTQGKERRRVYDS